ncbi:SusC/RagA family TonB-linked outer membrane protein [Flagellimonas onchidii]|uniref:SusC/RagA family TonB-linked outer membrane protein n=1 Tax=Flagellimonas onchidii TaxID=2562684 RepID=UPI00145617CA|nr:SusC/RagA family TonB-linked outer membrane protein [Allomuricauda onchidii]
MRTLFFLCCSIALGFTPENGFSQNAKITIDSDKTVTVEEVFRLIKAQTDYTFIFKSDQFKDHPKVQLEEGVLTVKELLEKSVAKSGYKIGFTKANTILVVPRPNKATLIFPEQDTFMITGTVTNEVGQPLAGASVYVNSQNPNEDFDRSDFAIRGTTTDFEGNFELEVSINYYLIVGYIGFEQFSQQITSKDQTVFQIILKESKNQLDEVVVTGYTSVKRNRTAASSTKIGGKAIERQITLNVASRLEGLSPGLLTTVENADGGEELTFTLRGQSTFDQGGVGQQATRANRAPLIVVDGFPIEGGINSVNPNDIESIDQLQDAAATALWGVRASNGVIVITTKKGGVGRPQFTYSTNLFISEKPNLDDYQVASAADLVDVISEGIQAGQDFDAASGNNRRFLNGVQQVWWDYYNQSGTSPGAPDDPNFAPARDAALAQLSQNDSFREWEDNLLRTSFSTQHNFSVRGGNGAHNYYFSTTYNDIESVEIGDKSNRLNLLLNNDFRFSDKFSANIGVNAVFDNAERNAEGIGTVAVTRSGDQGDASVPRFTSLYNADGSLANVPRRISLPYQDELLSSGAGFLPFSYNPITEMANNDFTTRRRNYRFNIGLQYKLTDWLTADAKGQYETGFNERRAYRNESNYNTRWRINSWLSTDANGFPVYAFPRGGVLDLRQSELNSYTLRGQLLFNKVFNKHHITATIGAEIREYTTDEDYRQLLGYNDQTKQQDVTVDWRFLSNVDRSYRSIIQSFGPRYSNPAAITTVETRQVSSFGNLVYTFDNRYSLNFTIKNDQTNIFGVSARLRTNPLWAVGANWNVTNEKFFNVNWIDNLNIKGSYGIAGNILPGSRAVSVLSVRQGITSNGERGVIGLGLPGNPQLSFERTATTNLALEGNFFGRLFASFEYYDKTSTDLLIPGEINPTLGFRTLIINDGELKNTGFTAVLAGDIVQSEDFTWNTNFNFSYNKNQVVSYDFQFPENAQIYIIRGGEPGGYFEGMPLGVRAAYQWAGLTDTGGSQILDANGNIVRYDSTEFGFGGIEDENALTFTKPFQAPYFGGWTNAFTYKGFTLSALISYKMGHVYKSPYETPFTGITTIHRDVANRWQQPGDEATTDIPYPWFSSFTERANSSSYFDDANIRYKDASFVRLRDITLRYDLNKEVLKRLPFEGISFTAQVRNLGLLWRANKEDIDPDYVPFSGGAFQNQNSFILSRETVSPNKQFVLGLEFQF